jgi:hypothetical protein
MTKQWGTSTDIDNKPNWLVDTPRDQQKENTYAGKGGWTLKRKDGTEEILVAVRGLNGRLQSANVTQVVFSSGAYTAGTTKTIRVSFDEQVVVTGTPRIAVTGSVVGAITANYVSTKDNVLTFSFTVPAAGNVLSVAAQTINLNGGTIVDGSTTPTVNVTLTISSTIATAAGTKTAV